ncbi:membrane protein [Nocardia sp. CNY236]|uniref:membrane protein n=1 Tax=Nocardia sp. CNY236 TaxID=1169152 RepID=UPI00041FA67F|nr:membrane protein [Nocardia sp. CNY236]
MIGKRTRWTLLAIVLVTTTTVGGAIALRTEPGPVPTEIALVDTDSGPTGSQVVASLQAAGGYEWTVTAPNAANVEDYAAVIVLPTDLTESLGTLASTQPKRAEVIVRTHDEVDADHVAGAVTEVRRHIGAVGVDAALAAATHARSQMSQIQFTAQLLGMGVDAAAAGAEQFSSGAAQLLDFLDFAKEGSAQLSSAIAMLNSTVDGAAAQAHQLADALDSTDITIAQVEQTADTVSGGLDEILPLLHATPFADDPILVDVIAKLEALRAVSDQAGSQLTELGSLVGGAVDPDTDLGTVLRTVVDRLTSASAQLSEGAKLAEDLPQLAEQGGAQLVDAIGQLTDGVGQLQKVVANLTTQTDKAVAALPQRTGAQQSKLALALTDPVEIILE